VTAHALLLDGVTKGYGRLKVLRGIQLEVAAGEHVALAGPNGSGKSTLLRLAATILRPDAGTVRVAGLDAHLEGTAARRSLAYVGQEAPAYDELTVAEHLAWWARLRGLQLPDDAQRAALEDAGLATRAGRKGGALSRGERQRLALAMAFVGEPPLLLLDEPATGLDAAGTQWLARRVERYPGAVLMASHGEPGALGAHRSVTLADGRLREGAA
jgi:ABC-type multidrug transport system ATPase subunit